jgi:hypothetical protein
VARIALAVAAFARYGLDRTQSARLRERFSGWPR